MKKNLLVIAGLLCVTAGALAQGTIQFNNRVTGTSTAAVVAPVYGPDPANPTQAKYGNPATAGTTPIPAGTQTYGGQALVGSGFTASIWARAAGSGAAFVQAATTPFRAAGSTSTPGFWVIPGTAVILPNVPSDPTVRAEILIRVWDNQGGTITAWDTAVQRGNVAVGQSLPFTVSDQLGGGVVLSPTLRGLESFNLTVPEPSVIALGVLGAGCLFLLRRRK
jgi:hypothetical protein